MNKNVKEETEKATEKIVKKYLGYACYAHGIRENKKELGALSLEKKIHKERKYYKVMQMIKSNDSLVKKDMTGWLTSREALMYLKGIWKGNFLNVEQYFTFTEKIGSLEKDGKTWDVIIKSVCMPKEGMTK